jgi:hypothetical protein
VLKDDKRAIFSAASHAQRGERLSSKQKMGVWAGAQRRPFASPETGLKRHPQERQHSACHLLSSDRKSGTECLRRGVHYLSREGSKPEGF